MRSLSAVLHFAAGIAPRRLAGAAGVALAALALSTAQAQAPSFPRTLEDIKVFGRGETIQFVFSKPYDGIPSEEHAPGRMALTFVGVGSQKPVRDLRPREGSLYQEIKVVQNRYSTTVTFLLRDSKLNLKDRISYGRDGTVFNVDVQLPGAAKAAAPAQPAKGDKATPLLSEMEKKIAPGSDVPAPAEASAPKAAPQAAARPAVPGAPAPAAPAGAAGAGAAGTAAAAAPAPLGLGGMPDTNFFASLATMIVALAIMLGGLYGVLYFYKRYVHTRLARFAGTPSLRQIASFSIGPRQRIVILEINGEWIACGVTPSQITFLTRLTGAQHAAEAESSAVAQAVAAEAAAAPETPAVKPDPVHQFAEVLKQKVRSLKRIN
jgi:flagellar protein FliO/FliZ